MEHNSWLKTGLEYQVKNAAALVAVITFLAVLEPSVLKSSLTQVVQSKRLFKRFAEIEKLNPEKSRLFIAACENHLNLQAFVLQADRRELQLKKASVMGYPAWDKNFTGVVIPIVGAKYNLLSSMIAIFDPLYRMVYQVEIHVTKSRESTFQFTSFLNGQTYSKVSDIEYINNEEFMEGLNQLERIALNPRNKENPSYFGIHSLGVITTLILHLLENNKGTL